MNHYSDPTASRAMGTVDREILVMRRRARQIRSLHRSGRLTPGELARANKEFVGIYRRLLLEALRD